MVQPSNRSAFVRGLVITKARKIAPVLGSAIGEGSGTVSMSFRSIETCLEVHKTFRLTDTGVAGGIEKELRLMLGSRSGLGRKASGVVLFVVHIPYIWPLP